MKRWERHKRNAMAVVAQFERGEWEFVWNPNSSRCLTAVRDGKEIWLGNGGFFVEMYKPKEDCFGWFWRHYVWHMVKHLLEDANWMAQQKHLKPPMRLWEETSHE